jgi:hypothetical protein
MFFWWILLLTCQTNKKRFEMGFKLLQGMTPMKDPCDDGIAKGTTI